MNKPAWVSFCGWLFWACIGIGSALPLFLAFTHARPPVLFLAGILVVIAWPCLLLWVIGSIVHKSRVHQAGLQAAAMRAAFETHKSKAAS